MKVPSPESVVLSQEERVSFLDRLQRDDVRVHPLRARLRGCGPRQLEGLLYRVRKGQRWGQRAAIPALAIHQYNLSQPAVRLGIVLGFLQALFGRLTESRSLGGSVSVQPHPEGPQFVWRGQPPSHNPAPISLVDPEGSPETASSDRSQFPCADSASGTAGGQE